MIEITPYRPGDRDAMVPLQREVMGDELTEALGRRWDWLYHQNPALADGSPLVWLARAGDAVVGQIGTIRVRLQVNGAEIVAAWGTDALVALAGQRQGLGSRLYKLWEDSAGASLALNMSDASHALFRKLGWHDMGRLPRLFRRLTPGAPGGPDGRLRRGLATLALPLRRLAAAVRPLGGDVRRVAVFDDSFTRLWERLAPKFAFGVRRDAAYLQWRYLKAPHFRYFAAALTRDGEMAGYVVYRHAVEPGRRLTVIVDFLADPDDPRAMSTLLRWVEREAQAARSDIIRVFTTHAGYRAHFRAAGFETGTPGMRFVVNIRSVTLPPGYYESTDRWHVTSGDSDADR
jgi:predicted N-acetyltransferase YhbS